MEVMKGIKDRSFVRVIVLTAHEEILTAELARERGVFSYLPKASSSFAQAIQFTVEQAFNDIDREFLARKHNCLIEVQQGINANRPLYEVLQLVSSSILDVVGAYTCH